MAESSKPNRIVKMIDAVMKAAGGDYSIRIAASDNGDELERLGDAIRELIGHVKERADKCQRMEAALHENKEKYRRLKDNIPGMLYLFALHPDGSYSFPYVSPESRELFGIEPEDLMRDWTLVSSLIHPEDRERFNKSVKHSAKTLQPWREELRHIVNGEVRWYDCISRPERQPNGDILWDGIILEVTHRRRAEEALRENEKMFRVVSEMTSDCAVSFRVNPGGGVQREWRFGAYESISGYTEEELDKEGGMRGIAHPDDKAVVDESRRRSLSGESNSGEYRIVAKTGEVRWLQRYVRPIWDEAQGRVVRLVSAVRDVTETKRAEEEKARLEAQLFQAQKMESIGRLAGGVAHDFNNMLSVILGYAELIRNRLSGGDPLLKYVSQIEKAGGHSRDLTRQLLAFSRKQIIAPKPVRLNDLINETKKTLSRLIGEDVDLRFFPAKDLWMVNCDPSQVEQILVNLVVNARDAMPDGGALTIESANVRLDEDFCRKHVEAMPGEYVLFTVSDDGLGMDKETLSQIFEPFFTTKGMGEGTGLGLATVYGIVQQSGGFINVYSEPGLGTTFRIYFPRSMEEGEVREDDEEIPAASGGGTVLLVEDDEMVRDMTTVMLEALGYTVLVAGSPEDAVRFCGKREEPIDLLMTDVVMPGMNGAELRDRIEAIRPGIKVLFMSGYTSKVIVHHGVLEEGVNFLQKPFTMKDLARMVRAVITGRQSR